MAALTDIKNAIKKYDERLIPEDVITIGIIDSEVIDRVQNDLSYYKIVTDTNYSHEGDSTSVDIVLCGESYRFTITEYTHLDDFGGATEDDIEYVIKSHML